MRLTFFLSAYIETDMHERKVRQNSGDRGRAEVTVQLPSDCTDNTGTTDPETGRLTDPDQRAIIKLVDTEPETYRIVLPDADDELDDVLDAARAVGD